MDKTKTLIIKSNKLIGMQTQLSLVQMKIFALLISKTLKNPNSEYIRFNAKELMISCNITDSNYTILKNTTANMIKPVIFITNEIVQEQYPLLDGVVYGKWIVDIAIHRKVKPYILDVATKYTKYYFENISFLNSMHSIRLYELLKEYEFRWTRDFNIEDFRFLLNIKDWMYSRPYDLKTKIIEKAQKKIEKKTDISFLYQEKKDGRKLVWLSFKISSNSKSNKTVLKLEENSLNTILKTKFFLSDKQTQTVLQQFDEDYIKRNIDYTLSQKNIKNISWYFQKALEQDYWQTIFLQQEQKQEKQKKDTQNFQDNQKQKKLEQEQKKIKKQKIKDFIQNREEEVLELIPDFIEANKFLLQKLKVDLENIQELLKIIKWENTKIKGVRKLFMGFISHKFNN